jgi:small conductance mechanosensitive channel
VRLAHRAITRFVSRLQPEQAREALGILREGSLPDDTAPLRLRRAQRAETVGALLKSAAALVIWVLTVFAVLNQIGINLGALIAGASILGVAVSFGAQNLVRDFLAGVFVLLEDQYGVGDLIDTGAAAGTVEAVTLRITRLRDADGRVWYVRNGTITRIGNDSQGWSRALVDVPVAYDADISGIRDLLKEIAGAIWEDPGFRDVAIVEEPQVYGLEQISDKAMIFRITVKTVPAHQAEIARELRMRVKWALDRAGIPLAGV